MKIFLFPQAPDRTRTTPPPCPLPDTPLRSLIITGRSFPPRPRLLSIPFDVHIKDAFLCDLGVGPEIRLGPPSRQAPYAYARGGGEEGDKGEPEPCEAEDEGVEDEVPVERVVEDVYDVGR